MSIPQINSPAQSSPDSFEVDDDLPANPPSQWQSQHDQASPNGASSPASQQQPRNAAPTIQKRRRVTRACDECRRKKIKCDGKQPCTHCTVYSYGMLDANDELRVVDELTVYQTAHTTNPRTAGEILHHNILKLWKSGFNALRPSFEHITLAST